jgi:hypothetical protein
LEVLARLENFLPDAEMQRCVQKEIIGRVIRGRKCARNLWKRKNAARDYVVISARFSRAL